MKIFYGFENGQHNLIDLFISILFKFVPQIFQRLRQDVKELLKIKPIRLCEIKPLQRFLNAEDILTNLVPGNVTLFKQIERLSDFTFDVASMKDTYESLEQSLIQNRDKQIFHKLRFLYRKEVISHDQMLNFFVKIKDNENIAKVFYSFFNLDSNTVDFFINGISPLVQR